jgi:hypothetical protein
MSWIIKVLAGRIWFYKVEGMPCLNGINVYRADDVGSCGFIIKLGALHFRARYSKRIHQWFVNFKWYPGKNSQYSI